MKLEFVEKENGKEIYVRCDPVKRSINIHGKRYFLQFPYVYFQILTSYYNEILCKEVFMFFSETGEKNNVLIPPLPNLLSTLSVCMGYGFDDAFKMHDQTPIKLAELTVKSFFESQFEDPMDWEFMELYANKTKINVWDIMPYWQKLSTKNKTFPLIPLNNKLQFQFKKEQLDELYI